VSDEECGQLLPFPGAPRPRVSVSGRPRPAAGWERMEADWWEVIADTLTAAGEPWPREAVLMDLRWWAGQEHMGTRKRPGRPTLRKRWGWTDKHVRNVLKAEDEWGDHDAVQRRSSAGPAATRANAENRAEKSSAGPTEVPTRVRSQITDHRSTNLIEGEGGLGGDHLPKAPPPAPDGPPSEPMPRNRREQVWVDEVEPRILALGWRYDRADALSWVNRTRIALERQGVTREAMWEALQALLDKAEAGHVDVTNWKLTWRNWSKKRVRFNAQRKGSPQEAEAGEVFDRLAGLVVAARPLPQIDERTRAAWVAAGGKARAQRERRELRFMRREFVRAYLTDE
jgi:hypothetical protein